MAAATRHIARGGCASTSATRPSLSLIPPTGTLRRTSTTRLPVSGSGPPGARMDGSAEAR
eukprot:scaffold104476_cov67-Phaeocystis_antarctica.AAC.2